MYREFLLPVHRQLTRRLACPTVLHICGNTLDPPDDIATARLPCCRFESRVYARAAVDRAAGRISLMGNVNNPEVLLNGAHAGSRAAGLSPSPYLGFTTGRSRAGVPRAQPERPWEEPVRVHPTGDSVGAEHQVPGSVTVKQTDTLVPSQ